MMILLSLDLLGLDSADDHCVLFIVSFLIAP